MKSFSIINYKLLTLVTIVTSVNMISMSLVEQILTDLWNTELNYKGVRVNIFGIPNLKKHKRNSLQSTLSRLSKNGLIENSDLGWHITNDGKGYLKKSKNVFVKFKSPFKKSSPRNLIVMFDIPESRRSERFWLREHLKEFGYIMIQKSVWVGPSPLAKEFTSYLKKIDLGNCIKRFKLAKPYEDKT